MKPFLSPEELEGLLGNEAIGTPFAPAAAAKRSVYEDMQIADLRKEMESLQSQVAYLSARVALLESRLLRQQTEAIDVTESVIALPAAEAAAAAESPAVDVTEALTSASGEPPSGHVSLSRLERYGTKKKSGIGRLFGGS